MKGIIKAIKNGIYIHKRECGNSTIGFHTVAELFNGELVDLTGIMENAEFNLQMQQNSD